MAEEDRLYFGYGTHWTIGDMLKCDECGVPVVVDADQILVSNIILCSKCKFDKEIIMYGFRVGYNGQT